MNRKVIEEGIQWLEEAIGNELEDYAGAALLRILKAKLRRSGKVAKAVEEWADQMNIDLCTHEKDVFDDIVFLWGSSADVLPMALINTVKGWSPWVPASEVLGDEEISELSTRLRRVDLDSWREGLIVGDEVSWLHFTKNGACRTQGPIIEIEDDVATVTRGKKGKIEYEIPFRFLFPKDGDPLRSIMKVVRDGMVRRGEVSE